MTSSRRKQASLARGVVVPRLYLAIVLGDEALCGKTSFSFLGKYGDYYKNTISEPVLPMLLLSAKYCNFPTKVIALPGSSTLLENSFTYFIAWDNCKQVFCIACGRKTCYL